MIHVVVLFIVIIDQIMALEARADEFFFFFFLGLLHHGLPVSHSNNGD